MERLETTMRSWLVWLVPCALLVLLILWQTDWGRAFLRTPPPESGQPPQPLTLTMLPEYQATAKPETSRDAVERTLFNPTRRQAPVALAEAAKPRMQRGQFALSGTLLVDGKATALLREVNGGKSRRVGQGESINGMVVADIRPDRVRLTLGDESEELALKIAVGPKATIQPVAPVATAAVGGMAGTAGGTPPQVRDVAEVLAERRRMAREAEAAQSGRAPGTPVASAQGGAVPQLNPGVIPTAPSVAPNTDPQWQAVYQRYQQPRR